MNLGWYNCNDKKVSEKENTFPKMGLMFTILREILFVVPLIYLFVFVFDWGLVGIWLGLCIGRAIASVLNYAFARYEIRRTRVKFGN